MTRITQLVHIGFNIRTIWTHSSVWIEWLPAEQLVEGSNPSGPEYLNFTTLLFSVLVKDLICHFYMS